MDGLTAWIVLGALVFITAQFVMARSYGEAEACLKQQKTTTITRK